MRLHRERTGSGAPLVLSHGLGDDSTTWRTLAPLLAVHRSVVTWDLRGHGRSDAPSSPVGYTSGLAVADLQSVVDEVDEPVHLVGHSLGGYLSLTLALRRPEQVRSLTMIASGPGYRDPKARAGWNRFVDKSVVRMPIPPEAASLAMQHDSWVIDNVHALEAPLLVLVGARDVRFHGGAEYLRRTVPTSTLRHISGAGHHPQRTHAEEVADAVVRHTQAD